jgi:hypothetical protein
LKTKYLYAEKFSFSYYSVDGKLQSMDTQIAIYSLIDPRTKLPFYVGKTNDPKIRLKSHRAGRGTTPSAVFIREIRAEGHRPEMEILELCDEKNWQDHEAFWVELYQFRFGETQILNVMEGGVQVGRFIGHSDATKERLRQMFKGRAIPQEVREKISKSLTGLKQSSETVAKRFFTYSKRRVEKGLPPIGQNHEREVQMRRDERKKKGVMVHGSEEYRRNAAEKQRAYYASLNDEQKEAVAAIRRGKPGANAGRKFGPLSPELKAKLSEIHKRRLASLSPEQKEARMAAARKAQPEAWRTFLASKTKEERKAMMAAADAANPMKQKALQGG